MEVLEKTEVRLEVSANADKLWKTISGIGCVDQWFSGLIKTCRVEGQSTGAKRYCTMADGTKLTEEIVEIDHEHMTFTYKIDDNPALPATSVKGTMVLKPLSHDKTEFTWKAEYRPSKENPDAMRKMLEEVYPMGIRSLESFCSAN